MTHELCQAVLWMLIDSYRSFLCTQAGGEDKEVRYAVKRRARAANARLKELEGVFTLENGEEGLAVLGIPPR